MKHIIGTRVNRNTIITYSYISVEKTEWENLSVGDIVYIQGNIINNQPTAVYGPHQVVNVGERILCNASGREFYERSPFVYMEKK
jgi:tartrate dehydratase beta subunit/fumarate hydratase class I family protein